MKPHWFLGIALALSVGCSGIVPVGPSASGRGKTIRTKPPSSATNQGPLALESQRRTVPASGDLAQVILSGQVRLISDKGAGLISNNGGGIIANNGGGIIANNGGGLISNNGGGYRVLQSGQAPAEALLADAAIEVLDAQGRVLVDERGTPVQTVSDKQARYRFEAKLPKENLLLRIRLYQGGQLFAMLTHDAARGERTLDIDTASSLGASYVLAKYVQRRQDIFNRLPGTEAEALRRDMELARAFLDESAPTYRPEDMVFAAEALRTKSRALDTTLERIKAILLAGQSNLGEGLLATRVSLSTPVQVTGDDQGNLYVAEASGGRIRIVRPDGTIGIFAGAGTNSAGEVTRAYDAAFANIQDFVRTPEGTFYLAEGILNQVRQIAPEGQLSRFVGTGERGQGPVDRAASEATIFAPNAVAWGADGTLYVAEAPKAKVPGRLLRRDRDGLLRLIDFSGLPEFAVEAEFSGLAAAADGTLYVLERKSGVLAKRAAAGAWEVVDRGLDTGTMSRIALTRSGDLLVCETHKNRIHRYPPGGARVTIAGSGVAGTRGDGGAATEAELNLPAGVWEARDGTIYFTDSGSGLVRAIDAAGRIRTVAGSSGLTQQGQALNISINTPGGIAIDSQGRVVVAEAGSSTIKRLEGDRLVAIAGTSKGFAGDGGPALTAQLASPAGIAYAGDRLYVIDADNNRIRLIAADGTITTVVGTGNRTGNTQRRIPALEAAMRRPIGLAIGPNGLPYWTDHESGQIWRLTPDGFAEVVAGPTGKQEGDAGDGGPAESALFRLPSNVAFDSQGALYVADSGNLRIRKIVNGTITTYAGINEKAALARLLAAKTSDPDGSSAAEALLLGPISMCFDAQDNLYVAEIGTSNLASFIDRPDFPVALLPQTPSRIRKVTPDGRIFTVAGPGTAVLNEASGDNSLRYPLAMVIDREGRLVISDTGNNQIKLIPKGAF